VTAVCNSSMLKIMSATAFSKLEVNWHLEELAIHRSSKLNNALIN